MKSHCSCPRCTMFLKHSCCTFLVFTLGLLTSQTLSYAMPGNDKGTPSSAFASGKGNRSLALLTSPGSSSTHPLGIPLSSDRRQRFCLNRLIDALHVVCSSGSASTMPLYFNPWEYSSINDTSSVPFNGGIARNLKNDISTMAQPQTGRRVIRRRSRRNIVRECCEKPCAYNSLIKYCSTSLLRTPEYYGSGMRSDNPPVQPSASQQCVTVADLQNFYMKFFHKQWKKPDNQGRALVSDSGELLTNGDTSSFPYSFPQSQRKIEPLSPIAPPPATEQEPRVVNEIGGTEETDPTSPRVDQSGNLMTLPPLLRIVNLPRGTNDYMY